MKTLIKAILRRFGVIVMKRESRIYVPEGESYRIALAQCGETAAPVIIDGGAHKGDTVEAFRALAAGASFHCFEADSTLAEDLRRKFSADGDVKVVAAALGEEPGMAIFNINASRPTSSLLPTADNLQSDLQGLCQTVERVEVPVISIDAYCRQQGLGRVDIIKLDLQGYDYHALVGARKVLQGTRVVLTEVLFTEIYRGCRLFPDILALMGECGFRLFTLSGLHYGPSDELLWADAIFVRNGRSQAGLAGAA